MEITIGKITKEVNRVIYISPKGSDSNDGLSKQTPLLRLDYAINYIVSLGGGAICFMEGEHDFTDQKQYQGDNSNNAFIRDFDWTKSMVGKKIIFYSEKPEKTLIKCISTFVKGYNRTQFIYLTNKDSGLYNLNLLLQSNVSTQSSYDGIFTAGNGNTIYNCIFDVNCPGWGYNYMIVGAHGGSENFVGCIFKSNSPFSPGGTVVFDGCVFNKQPTGGAKDNCLVNSDIQTMTYKKLYSLSKDDNPVGLNYGEYSVWNKLNLNLVHISKYKKENLSLAKKECDINIVITDNKELYINDKNNEFVKIIHQHNNLDTLNSINKDMDNNLLIDNKKIKYKAVITDDELKSINYKLFGYPYKTFCNLANIDCTQYTSLTDILNNESNQNKIINSVDAINYLFLDDTDCDLVNEVISNKEFFTKFVENEYCMNCLCNSQNGRNAIYDNYKITENIITNSSNAMSVMMNSSQYEKVSHSMTTAFSNLYDGKAFVFGISQEWHNGTTYVTITHGHYLSIDGNTISERGASGIDQGSSGLVYRVNKFADYICQKNSYGNASSIMCHAAIFKI